MTEIDSILKDAQSVAVSGHVRPEQKQLLYWGI